jgi:hypothetical protein
MLSTIGRFRDDELPVVNDRAITVREFFAQWAQELTRDFQTD